MVTVGRTLAVLGVMVSAGAAPIAAQVGLGSKVAQVTLSVPIAPAASIPGIGPIHSSRSGTVTEASVKVSLSTNSGFRLMAVGLPSSRGSRLWVRSATGELKQLEPGASVMVAREQRAAGRLEREVSYRIESAAEEGEIETQPLRYEVVITPAI
jgi:hypothetical protein